MNLPSTNVTCSPQIAFPLFLFYCSNGEFAVSSLYDVVTIQDQPYQLLEFEEYAPMDISSLKRSYFGYSGAYSSFSIVEQSGKSITLHDYYPRTGQIGVHPLPLNIT